MTAKDFKARIIELEQELEDKEQQIIKFLDKIEELEDTILEFQNLISDENPKTADKKWKRVKYSMLEMELEDKEKQIRDLKDSMGFLRKEKIQLQLQLEKYTRKESNSTVIRIEEKKEPLEALVKDLQNKINKQQMTIAELEEQIRKVGIQNLKTQISELRQKLEAVASPDEISEIESLFKATPEQLRKKVIKTNKQIKILENKLEKFKKKSKKIETANGKSLNEESREIIEKLREESKNKDDKIKELTDKLSESGQDKDPNLTNHGIESAINPSLELTEELQRKLNKAKIKIKNLQKKLEDYEIWKTPLDENNQDEIIKELRNKLERINCQDQVIDELYKISKQIKQSPSEDPDFELRINELTNLIEELKIQNTQQRLEISKLRKK